MDHLKLMKEALKKWKMMKKADIEFNEATTPAKERAADRKFQKAHREYHKVLDKLDAWEMKHKMYEEGEQYNRRHGGEYWRYHPEAGNWSDL